MRYSLFVLITLAQVSLANPNRAPSMVDVEYTKTKESLTKSYGEHRELIRTLKEEREHVLASCVQAVRFYREGEKELSRYDRLLPVRYLDASGKYEDRLAMSAEDVKNLNALIEKYLNAKPIPERVSVRRARKLVARAMDELDDLTSENRFPHESVISELEVIALKLENAEDGLKRIEQFAKRLDVKLDRNLASAPEKDTSQEVTQAVKAEKTPTQPTRPGAGSQP